MGLLGGFAQLLCRCLSLLSLLSQLVYSSLEPHYEYFELFSVELDLDLGFA